MQELADYFAMGGHGLFIWLSYGISLGIIIVLLVWSLMQMRSREKRLATLQATMGQRGAGGHNGSKDES